MVYFFDLDFKNLDLGFRNHGLYEIGRGKSRFSYLFKKSRLLTVTALAASGNFHKEVVLSVSVFLPTIKSCEGII